MFSFLTLKLYKKRARKSQKADKEIFLIQKKDRYLHLLKNQHFLT